MTNNRRSVYPKQLSYLVLSQPYSIFFKLYIQFDLSVCRTIYLYFVFFHINSCQSCLYNSHRLFAHSFIVCRTDFGSKKSFVFVFELVW